MAFLAAKLRGSLSELSQIIAAKTLKKSILLTDSDVQTLLEEEKPTYKKEKLKVTYSVALVMTFLVAENQNDNWKISYRPILAIYLYIFSVSKDKVNIWEFCKLKITPIVVFVIMIQPIFPSWALSANALYDKGFFNFLHWWSWLFLSLKGYCVYMKNKIIHSCL